MSNQSRKKKQVRNGVIIGLIVLLVVAFFVSQSSNKIDPETFANVVVIEPTAHLKGNLESEIKLIEYSNFKCSHCAAVSPEIDKLIEDFGDKFSFEFKHFPFMVNADIAAYAAEAAGMQGKFWEMHDMLFANQNEWGISPNPKRHLKKYAKEIGINVDRFTFDLESDTVKDVIESHLVDVGTLELTGTPAFVFSGEIIDLNTFINENLIEKESSETEIVE